MKKKFLLIIIATVLTSGFISCGKHNNELRIGGKNSIKIKSADIREAHAEKMFELGRMAVENQGGTVDGEKKIFNNNGSIIPILDDSGLYWFSLFGSNEETGEFIFKIEIKCHNNNGNLDGFVAVDLNNSVVADLVRDVTGGDVDFTKASAIINENIKESLVSLEPENLNLGQLKKETNNAKIELLCADHEVFLEEFKEEVNGFTVELFSDGIDSEFTIEISKMP